MLDISHLNLIDSHAHLHSPEFTGDIREVLKRASESGVGYIIDIGSGDGMGDIDASLELSDRFPNIYSTIGIHPHSASIIEDDTYGRLKTLSQSPKVVAIGETGLDYHYLHSPEEDQKRGFRLHIALAKELSLPIILHVREAYRDAIDILKEEGVPEACGVVHCFSGGVEDAMEFIDMGFYISFTGVVTFPNAHRVREVVGRVPVERILIETDCPYLTPHPFRGRRNEPSYLHYIAERIAEIKGLSTEDIGRITRMNTERLFRIGGDKEESPRVAYPIRDSLYLNITNRCTNYCSFCPKFEGYIVKGHYLKLDREPSFEEIIEALKGCERYKEVVFCGFGEPLLRIDLVCRVARWLKDRGMRVRIDTDGLANLVHGRNVLEELKGLVDAISISLNAPDEETYSRYCRSRYGKDAYRAVKAFIKESRRYIPEVTATVVSIPGIDIEACRRVAEEELGVRFRVREYNNVG